MIIFLLIAFNCCFLDYVFGQNFPSPLKYFDLDDARKVTWERNVNSQETLLKALDGPVMMIEANVIQNGSELRLKDSLDNFTLRSFLVQISFSHKKKGISLYFDDISVVSPAIKIIKEELPDGSLPLLLGADILPGPVSNLASKVPADAFLSLVSSQLPGATLSPGWVTDIPPDYNGNYSLTKDYIEAMNKTIQKASITQPVMFSVRAPFTREPFESLISLVKADKSRTVRVVSFKEDEDLLVYSDIPQLVDEVGKDRVYLDMPDNQLEELYQFFGAGTVNTPVSFSILATLSILLGFLL